MALVRILIDGSGLLQSWQGLGAGKPRHSAAAKSELITQLTRYFDARGTALTVIFDDAEAEGEEELESSSEVEILFVPNPQGKEQLLKRLAHRLSGSGEVLVVSDAFDPQVVAANGRCQVSDCASFAGTVEEALLDLQETIVNLNRKEQDQFKRAS